MERIKNIVNDLDIPTKREKLQSAKLEIQNIKVAMSNLTLNRDVAKYAYNLDKMLQIINLRTKEAYHQMKQLREEMYYLEIIPEVVEYQRLWARIKELEQSISEYYRTIQIDLRKELIYEKKPEIYVYQGFINNPNDLQLSKHIIIPGTMQAYYNPETVPTIYPESSIIKSNREARHFYNQVSFKYLEQLTEDYSFDLEGKDLGKVKVLKRG